MTVAEVLEKARDWFAEDPSRWDRGAMERTNLATGRTTRCLVGEVHAAAAGRVGESLPLVWAALCEVGAGAGLPSDGPEEAVIRWNDEQISVHAILGALRDAAKLARERGW